ncbi:MAG: hypothetical protein FWE42_09365 [Defluviitaleaceae bacterium]|nr:hypothetical protein [Defluviitaleaceae bacterium]
MTLYTKRDEKTLTPALFKSPTAEYRGAPFWAWNCKLDKKELFRQIDIFKEMGIGGFHIHSRSGMATPYMSDEFLDLVEACNEKAINDEMLCYLYDEDRWPSGAAGGKVTKDYEYRQRYLVLLPYGHPLPKASGEPSTARYVPSGKRVHLARYRVTLTDGYLTGYQRLALDAEPTNPETIWDAYMEIAGDSAWFNNQSYVDTLNKKAIDRFIEETHEPYKKRLGKHFGKTIPSIFTDEPQFSHKQTLTRSDARRMVALPFTTDFDETYTSQYGRSILDTLPEVVWEMTTPSKARYYYHDHICARFTEAFADTLGNWCQENGIMLTGHMMHEESLTAQTQALGETMRAYRSFQLPGIDMLCDRREYATAKQAQSAVHQYGREGLLSELYGVTNWDFDFRSHKLQGDWQAALGVTLRVHHLTWVSMGGEAKRDYPACIGYQSPWYKEYAHVEDHFARLNTALVRGRPLVKVAVVHPIESFWMHFGPNDKTAGIRAEMEADFENIIKWLLFGQIDFDFVAESLLPDLYKDTKDGTFTVGEMAYDVVLVPNCRALRSTTLKALETHSKNGGKVILAGEPANIVDGEASAMAADTLASSNKIPFSRTAVLAALEGYRDISIWRENGSPADWLIYQMRQDGTERWLFVCNGTKPENMDIPQSEEIRLQIKGEYMPTLYNTHNGSILPIPAEYENGMTVIRYPMHMHDSLLLKLSPGKGASVSVKSESTALPTLSPSAHIPDDNPEHGVACDKPAAFRLHEPNVLVLDMAEYSMNGGPLQAPDEILRIDNIFRQKLGYPLRVQSLAQPWTLTKQEASGNVLKLRFKIASQVTLDEVSLALEGRDSTIITWNGEKITTAATGYYVDHAIQTVALPGLKQGENELVLEIPFEKRSNVENCFLLGQFGVSAAGKYAAITPYPEALAFGDIRFMGLPFYGGNFDYVCKFYAKGGPVQVEAAYFRCPLLSVALDGKPVGPVAFAPYIVDLGHVEEGWHELTITAYGNRVNTFGPLHNANETLTWYGPPAWRSEGAQWCYEYRTKPVGIMKSPQIIQH